MPRLSSVLPRGRRCNPTSPTSPGRDSPGRDLEVLHEGRRESLCPIDLLRQQALIHHQVIRRLPALLGDDADPQGLGVAAVEHYELVAALDGERDLFVA